MSETKKSMTTDMVEQLNEILKHEKYHFDFYFHASSELRGIARTLLKPLFEKEMSSELGHMKLFADKIVALGGTPTRERLDRDVTGYFSQMAFHEVLGAACAMEEEVLGLYHRLYPEAEKYAEVFGDKSIVLLLEENIEHTTADLEEMRKMY